MRTIAEDEEANEPDIVVMAKVLMPLAWQHEGGPRMRDASLRIAAKAREQFRLEQQTSDNMLWEMGALHGRREAEAACAEREAIRLAVESTPRHHWRAFWRAAFGRKPKPNPHCRHSIDWDSCPECCH